MNFHVIIMMAFISYVTGACKILFYNVTTWQYYRFLYEWASSQLPTWSTQLQARRLLDAFKSKYSAPSTRRDSIRFTSARKETMHELRSVYVRHAYVRTYGWTHRASRKARRRKRRKQDSMRLVCVVSLLPLSHPIFFFFGAYPTCLPGRKREREPTNPSDEHSRTL